jgi:DNA primase
MHLSRKEFLSKFDFEGYVVSRFSPLLETSDTDRVRVLCPMCGDTTGHLYILLSAGLPYCQRCKYDPKSPVRFIADVEGISFSDVFKMCGDSLSHLDVSVEEAVESLFKEEEEEEFEYEVVEMDNTFVPVLERVNIPSIDKVLAKACEYLEARGLRTDQIKKYDIRYCYDGKYSGRIIIPCFYDGDFVTFVARDIFNVSSRKYLNPLGNKQSDFLFNLDSINSDNVVLTEGVFDAISASLVFPAVASFGKSLSKRQLNILNSFKTVMFYWDKDAYPQAERYADSLQSDCSVVLHSDGKDAGSRSYEENKNLMGSAVKFNSVDYSMFKLLNLNS